MDRVCYLRNVESRMLLKNHTYDHAEAPGASVDFVLADLLYNIGLFQGIKNSKHDNLASADMKSMSKLCCGMLQTGGHKQIICIVLQFGW